MSTTITENQPSEASGGLLPVDTTLYTRQKLIRLLIPLVLEQLLFLGVGAVDTMMISRFGEDAISGVSLVDAINVIVGVFFAAMATGGAVVTAQFLGAKKYQDAQTSARQLLIVAAVMGLFFLPIMYCLRERLFRLSYGDVPAGVTTQAMIYFQITVFTYPFMALYMAYCAIFRAMNYSTISMAASFCMNVLNACGNWLLLFVFQLGIAGAAYSTLVARMLAVVFLAWRITRPCYEIRIEYGKICRLNLQMIQRILFIGIPSGIENTVFQFGRLLTTGFIATFGINQIAANAISNMISGVSCIVASAFCLAMITVIGQSVGTGSELTVKYYVHKMMKLAYGINFITGVPLFFCVPLLLRCFGDLSTETYRLALITISTYIVMQTIFWPASFVFPNALRSANDVRFVMGVSIFSMLVVRVGLAYVFAKVLNLGITGAWWGMYCDWFVRIIIFWWRWFSGTWKRHVQLR